jgi:Uma2 family endonuclease
MSITLSRRLFTTREFRNMIETGVLGEDDRVELVDGEIVEMAATGHRHATCVRKLNHLFQKVGDRALVDVQNPLGISGGDDFYPDIVLLKPRDDVYSGTIPQATDALLVVEVSDTTLEFDRTVKLPRYAAAGVPELWIVDLKSDRIWVHRKSLEGDYGEVFEAHPGDVLQVADLPDIKIKVEDILA